MEDQAFDAKGRAICTTDGRPVDAVRAGQTNATGQHEAYIVLCEEERRKGFVRPYRESYRHVGLRPSYPTRPLTEDEHDRYDRFQYVAYELYPDDAPERRANPSVTGRYWTAAQLASGCGTVTTMTRAIAETYARDPSFYGATFCCHCNRHLPVAEFAWADDETPLGS